MKRASLIMILLFSTISGSLLFIQWKGYTEKQELEEKYTVQQEVSVRHKNDQFYIEQTISLLQNGDHRIIFPPNSSNNQCTSKEDQECDWSISAQKLSIDGDDRVTFTYQLPAPQKKVDSYLLKDWLLQLEGIDSNTRIKFKESDWREGSWVGAAAFIGKKRMEFLDYYVFHSTDSNPPLYWQSKELFLHEKGRMVIYAEQQLPEDFQLPIRDVHGIQDKVYGIVTSAQTPKEVDGLWFVNSMEGLRGMTDNILKEDIMKAFVIPEKKKWLADLITSAWIGQPVGDEKPKKMYMELTDRLSEDELREWIDKVKMHTGELTAAQMDKWIKEVTGYRTAFFSENDNEQQVIKPMKLFDARPIYVFDKKVDDLHFSYGNDQARLTLLPFLSHIGFKVTNKGDAIYADKGAVHYIFYPDKRMFSLNGTQYGLQSAPITKQDGTIYIDQSLINTFFNVSIVETNEKIAIF